MSAPRRFALALVSALLLSTAVLAQGGGGGAGGATGGGSGEGASAGSAGGESGSNPGARGGKRATTSSGAQGNTGATGNVQGNTDATTNSGRSGASARGTSTGNGDNRRANPNDPNPQNKINTYLPTPYRDWRVSPR